MSLTLLLLFASAPALARPKAAPAPAPVEAPAPEASAAPAAPPAPPANLPAVLAPLDPPVAAAAAWVLDALDGTPPTEEDVAAHLDARFAAQVSPAQLLAVFGRLGTGWVPISVEESSARHAKVVLSGPTSALNMTVAIDPAEPTRLSGLLFTPVTSTSWADLVARLSTRADTVSLGVFRLTPAGCEPVYTHDAATPRPLGSTFKLYTLGTLAREVGAGHLGWDDLLVVDAATRSLPSGTMQDLPDGAKVRVGEAAAQMIRISDNTAADLLAARLGAATIEAALPSLGMKDPAGATPFLTTRQLFQLKWGLGAEAAARYAALDAAGRRAMLRAEVDPRPLPAVEAIVGSPPVAVDVEWFASGEDLCRLWGALTTGPEASRVRTIVSANPGLPFKGWAFVGFKGGSEPGVLAGTWLLESGKGDRYVLTVSMSDAARVIDDLALADLLSVDVLLPH